MTVNQEIRDYKSTAGDYNTKYFSSNTTPRLSQLISKYPIAGKSYRKFYATFGASASGKC